MIRTMLIFILIYCIIDPTLDAQQLHNDVNYWTIKDESAIKWDLTTEENLPHEDNIEMAGKNIAAIVYYSIDENKNISLEKDVIFPQLRTYNKSNEPDWKKYRAYYRKKTGEELAPSISYNDKIIKATTVDSIVIDGTLEIFYAPVEGIQISKHIYPSMEDRFLVEEWKLKNLDNHKKSIIMGNCNFTSEEIGYKGKYEMHFFSEAQSDIDLLENESYTFPMYYGATMGLEFSNAFNYKKAYKERTDFLEEIASKLVVDSPDSMFNTMFYFSKIRASESIYNSSMGIVHSPGGGNYYTGIWANDQIEYAGPFFPYLGYENGIVASANAYKMFLKNIPEDDKHIAYAFEVDGNFAMTHLDRGDAAMIAYGTSSYLLSLGNRELSEELWPLIEWSIAYCKKMKNAEGAIKSESDEMEGRIETGPANLSTSSLYYGGLKYASKLAKAIGKKKLAVRYLNDQKEMEQVIEEYFGATVNGLETYRYYDGNTNLRHWICLPMTMGITKRNEGTLKALFEKLWTENGVLVEYKENQNAEDLLFWDRATLYTLRGALNNGSTDLAFEKLKSYTEKRLLGDHVPYAVEAYPENNMKHLSAESALYCRILTEGFLGIEPIGFKKIEVAIDLPSSWGYLHVKKIYVSGIPIDIEIRRDGNIFIVKALRDKKLIQESRVKPNEKLLLSLQ